MSVSARFKQLRTRLAELREHLLPKSFSLIGDYTDRELDRARGYRLLVHAEIESYLEDISRETITHAIRGWKASKKPSIGIISFLASYHSSWSVTDSACNEDIIQIAKSRKNIKDSIDEIIDLAQRQYIKKVQDNHGVKEVNLKTLILPTGVDMSLLDQSWITNLDNFGSNRGEVAHKSKQAQTPINPKDEYELVKNLLSGLESLDKQINAII